MQKRRPKTGVAKGYNDHFWGIERQRYVQNKTCASKNRLIGKFYRLMTHLSFSLSESCTVDIARNTEKSTKTIATTVLRASKIYSPLLLLFVVSLPWHVVFTLVARSSHRCGALFSHLWEYRGTYMEILLYGGGNTFARVWRKEMQKERLIYNKGEKTSLLPFHVWRCHNFFVSLRAPKNTQRTKSDN